MRTLRYIPFIALWLLSSCTRYDYLPKPKDIQVSKFGANAKVRDQNNSIIATGELIAVNDTCVYVLTSFGYGPNAEEEVVTIPWKEISKMTLKVAGTSDHPGAISLWAGLLPITTLAHGIGLIISLPLNLAICIPVGVDASSSSYVVKYPVEIRQKDVYKFARFPQGMPRGVKLKDIQ